MSKPDWNKFFQFTRRIEDNQISDEAIKFALDEVSISDFPKDSGEWQASLEIAFEAGRIYQKLVDLK